MYSMQNGDLGSGDVREPGGKEGLSGPQVSRLPDVRIAGRAVEIRGDAAQLVQSVLMEWLGNQQRRIDFLRRDNSRESRETVNRIVRHCNVIHGVLRAWEGVLAVPVKHIE